METIVACRDIISERFPVASFTINVPEARYYEVACATDPRLFHTDNATRRSRDNFYTSRNAGLLPARPGSNTFMLPPEQLRRFAGARRLYYALGTYAGPRGERPRFSISPDTLAEVPSFGIATDFTGRTLDRRRLGVRSSSSNAYGASERALLRWGGDAALEAERTTHTHRARTQSRRRGLDAPYDDGYGAMPGALGQDDDLLRPEDLDGDMQVGREREVLGRVSTRGQGERYTYGRPSPRGRAGQRDVVRGVEDGRSAHAARVGQLVARPRAGAGASYGAAVVSGCEDGAQARARGHATPVHATASAAAPSYGQARGPHRIDRAGLEDGAQAHASGVLQRATSSYGGPRGEPAFEDGAQIWARDGRFAKAMPPPSRSTSEPAPAYGRPRTRSRRGRHAQYSEQPQEESLAVGPAAHPLGASAEPDRERQALTIADKVRILRVVARAESGDEGYSAIYADGEFEDPEHPFYQRTHVGLSWGLLLFTQRGGALGRVLRLAKQRDEAMAAELPAAQRFSALFGERAAELLERTDPERTTDAEARVAPVDGSPLWSEPWVERFRRAGAVAYVQAAQNQVAVEDYFDRALPLAAALGIDTARGLALIVDRLVHMGIGAGASWIMDSAGPIHSESERARALELLGFADDLVGFQRARGLSAVGWDAHTHAELVRALRERGDTTIPLPSGAASFDALVAAAEQTDFAERVNALVTSEADFDDAVVFELG